MMRRRAPVMGKSTGTSMKLFPHKSYLGAAVALCSAVGLAACSSEKGDWGQIVNIVTAAFGESPGVTIQQAGAIPFATIGIRIGDNAEGILVLASTNNGQRLWTSASHIVVLTREGRVLRTAGLPHNRTDMRLLKGDGGAPPLNGSAETLWEEDFGDLHQYSILVSCRSTV